MVKLLHPDTDFQAGSPAAGHLQVRTPRAFIDAQLRLGRNATAIYQDLVDLHGFDGAYNFARRLKTLKGLTPYEHICSCWTSQPDRFIINPIHQMPGLNT